MIDEDRSLQRSSHFDSERSRYDPGRPLSDASRMPIEEPSSVGNLVLIARLSSATLPEMLVITKAGATTLVMVVKIGP